MSLDVEKVRKALLVEHNRLRSDHDADALMSRRELQEMAQKWAEQLAKNNRLEHSHPTLNGSPVGENVFSAMNSTKHPTDLAFGATSSWYDEIEAFDFNKPEKFLSQCGHFAQVVWKSSKECGFGAAQSADGHVFVVGQYFPAGNFIGLVGDNVSKPKRPKRAHQLKTVSPIRPERSKTKKEKPVKTQSNTHVTEEVIDGKTQTTTVTTEVEYFADGSSRTTTRTKTEFLL